MLNLAYLGESKKMNLSAGDVRLLIVRKPVSGIPKDFIHVPQLSPSLQLFDQMQVWKTGIFRKEDRQLLDSLKVELNNSDASWFLYERAFQTEMLTRPDMVKALSKLGTKLEHKKEVYIFCYCKNVCRCHRGLIGKLMEQRGYPVDYRNVFERQEEKPAVEQLSLFD